jgi:hypothetical protein
MKGYSLDTGEGKKSSRRKPRQTIVIKTHRSSAPDNDVVNQVRKAYADAALQEKAHYDPDARNLEFLSSKPVPASQLYDVAKYIGGYNKFTPKRACDKILKADPDAQVWVGREGSVVMYIKLSSEANAWPLYDAFKKYGDEVGYVDSAPSRSRGVSPKEYVSGVTNILRVWWD